MGILHNGSVPDKKSGKFIVVSTKLISRTMPYSQKHFLQSVQQRQFQFNLGHVSVLFKCAFKHFLQLDANQENKYSVVVHSQNRAYRV